MYKNISKSRSMSALCIARTRITQIYTNTRENTHKTHTYIYEANEHKHINLSKPRYICMA